MKCEFCHLNEACVEVQQISDGSLREVHMCADCAVKGFKPPAGLAGLEEKEIVTVDDRADLGQPFRPHRAYLFVLDDAPLNTAALGGVFARLQPQQVAAYIEAQKRFHRFNGRVEQLLERIRQDPRTETVVVHDAQLRVLRFSEVQS